VSATDVLVVSLGTTRGLRVADAAFVDQVQRAGVSVEAVSVKIGATGRLRRAYPVNDLVEAAAARRAVASALKRRPRAVVFSTITAALLAPKLEPLLERAGFAIPEAQHRASGTFAAYICVKR